VPSSCRLNMPVFQCQKTRRIVGGGGVDPKLIGSSLFFKKGKKTSAAPSFCEALKSIEIEFHGPSTVKHVSQHTPERKKNVNSIGENLFLLLFLFFSFFSETSLQPVSTFVTSLYLTARRQKGSSEKRVWDECVSTTTSGGGGGSSGDIPRLRWPLHFKLNWLVLLLLPVCHERSRLLGPRSTWGTGYHLVVNTINLLIWWHTYISQLYIKKDKLYKSQLIW